MSQPDVLASLDLPRVAARERSAFYVGLSGVLLLIVLIGFAPTLYLRPVFDVPEVPIYLLLHGVLMTAWFVLVLVQPMLVTIRRIGLHRTLGWTGAALGAAVFAVSLVVTAMFVDQRHAANPDNMGGAARIFWANSAALLSFAVFLSTAVARRRQREVHKRLMALAGIALVQPAMARVRGIWFASVDGPIFAIVWLSILVGALAFNDLRVNRRVHPATLFGGALFLGSRLVAQYVIATSDVGLAVIAWLVA